MDVLAVRHGRDQGRPQLLHRVLLRQAGPGPRARRHRVALRRVHQREPGHAAGVLRVPHWRPDVGVPLLRAQPHHQRQVRRVRHPQAAARREHGGLGVRVHDGEPVLRRQVHRVQHGATGRRGGRGAVDVPGVHVRQRRACGGVPHVHDAAPRHRTTAAVELRRVYMRQPRNGHQVHGVRDAAPGSGRAACCAPRSARTRPRAPSTTGASSTRGSG